MDSTFIAICVGYMATLNFSIGLYIGALGADGLVRPRPVALLILLLCIGAPFLVLYAQENEGFRADAQHITISIAAFVIGAFAGRVFRSS